MVIGYWVLAVAAAAGAASTQGVDADVRELARSFRVIDAANNLFDAGDGYVLRLMHERGLTIEIKLGPRYHFRDLHPEWTEPARRADLSAETYTSILGRISKVKPIGTLLTKGNLALVTNSRSPFIDVHALAVVERGERSPLVATERGQIVSARIVYFRSIQGRVEDTWTDDDGTITPASGERRVKIGGRWHWVTQATFKTLTIGTVQTIQAAGPISEAY